MFRNCGIVVVQERGTQRDYAQVNLVNPKKTAEGVWLGRWILYTNSRSPDYKPGETYTIGTSAHPDYKFWKFEKATNGLYFCETENLIGGGLKFGEVLKDYKVTVACLRATITPTGIIPMNEANDEKAEVLVPSSLFLKGQTTTWTYDYIS
ncbi:MAG: hypothetical protein IPM21_01060 [Acidobacteria bacterium]|nr:hypothetical protein [Acidobacteriota bacterium]